MIWEEVEFDKVHAEKCRAACICSFVASKPLYAASELMSAASKLHSAASKTSSVASKLICTYNEHANSS